MENLKRVLWIPIVVALASQINISIMNSEFVVSVGIIVLMVLLFYYDDLNPAPLGFLSGLLVYILRLLVYSLRVEGIEAAVIPYMFEVLFYIFYTIIFSSLIKKVEDTDNIIFILLVICDFFANLIEMTARTMGGYSPTIWAAGDRIFIVSLIRSAIIWIIISALKNFEFNLLKKEHQNRYKKLIVLTSQLKSELYWIEKSMDHIENVMAESYQLYEKINKGEDMDSWSNRALSIAGNVHEIKKENNLIIQGIHEITEGEFNDKGMDYEDIVNILIEAMEREASRLEKDIEFDFKISNNFYVSNHYYLISILRNLIMNSMDAIDDVGEISLRNYIEDDKHLLVVSDTGNGIDEEDLEHMFSPGYSTKINYDTGEINRGLGLSIIQNIVIEGFKGDIKVESQLGEGTTFYIRIPINMLED